ncbi:PREDICTED: uncharacterized protein LOC105558199, partial [Vollenhovia emeryi]|uniref:uncharacterized protein LOC105558199 n=1 Tax=Vollenhovia emeryi TaxID=411798 RepID=UPI0005F4E88B
QEKFFRLRRLTVEQFEELLTIIRDDIKKRSYREFLTPEFRLALTLCYLASGNSIVSLSNYWKIGKSTAYGVIKETCEAIWKRLKSSHLAPPSTQEWKLIADGYWSRWNLPNCCGALDGKHIRLQCPSKSGSQFFNYKQFFSFVLMALCDSKYCFTWVEVGDYGSLPDSSIFTSSALGKAMEEGSLNFPDPKQLPGTNVLVPYYFVGDEAFPLRTDLMRPYPRRNLTSEANRIFNYRLSRARLTIENAFGILASRWRVLRTALAHQPSNVESIILATVCLHNFIINREEHLQGFKQYCPPSYVDHEDVSGNIIP